MEKIESPFSIKKRISVYKPCAGINQQPELDYVVPIYCMAINRKNFCQPRYCVNRGESVSRCTICLDAAKAISRESNKFSTKER